MAVVSTFKVPNTGTRRVFSIEDGIWDGQRTSVSDAVGRTLGTSRGVLRQIRTRGGGLGDNFKGASLQRHFWVRNAPYALKDPDNPLKLQQMRPPSERTRRKPLIRNMFSRFSTPALLLSADVTTPFRTNLHCLMACLGPELTPVVSHLHLNQRPAKENHDLLTRGQWRSLANKSAGSYSDPSPLRGLPSSPSNDLWV